MLRNMFIFFLVTGVLIAGTITVSQVVWAECPDGYPVDCGSYCCEAGSMCVDGTCCPSGYPISCGDQCCEAGDTCIDGICCPPGYTVNCGGYCCEAGSRCCGDYCCESGYECVDGGCCPPDYTVNCGDYCCEEDFVCCDDGCCPENYRECLECGKLLINSVSSGLRSSAMLRTYIWQARQSYANCIQAIPDACENVCGRQLFDILPQCDSEDYNDAGHRACVEESLSGAILECERLGGQ